MSRNTPAVRLPCVRKYRNANRGQTPSPHRFLTGRARQEPPAKTPKPASALRQQVAQNPGAQQRQSPDAASQFAATPRFSTGQRKPRGPVQRSPSPQKHSLVNALRSTGRPTEDVEDVPDQAEDDEMLDLEQTDAVPTTEHGNEQQWSNDLAFSPKRRRLGDDRHSPDVRSSNFKRPQQPASRASGSVPPFASLQAHLNEDTTSIRSTSPQRPAFLRPSAPPQEPTEPLPETFSPHKRGQKFVPGGMAAVVQQWVIEAGQTAVQSRRRQGYLKGEHYVTRVKIDQVLGAGPFTALGKNADGEQMRLLLAGRAGADNEAARLGAGDVVGIRAPTWDVGVDGRMWAVGVDWKQLS